MAAVKANAYGHGLVRVAGALDQADALAVARMAEAETLRASGIRNSIVLMGGVINDDELARADDLDCDLVVHSHYQLELLERSAAVGLRVWLKIDTGMHRLGIRPRDANEAIERLGSLKAVGELGLMTHLANADDRGDGRSLRQIERFRVAAEGFSGHLSIANSAALLGWSEALRNALPPARGGEHWIRPGISLYGVSPFADASAADLGLLAVMNFDTVLIAVKQIDQGGRVGYGGHWRASRDTVLGIAAAGYGDGYSRFIPSGTPVLVNDRRAKIAGVISMDLLAIDLGPGARDRVGDPVRLWGEGLPVEEIAASAGTTAYPLVTGVLERGQTAVEESHEP